MKEIRESRDQRASSCRRGDDESILQLYREQSRQSRQPRRRINSMYLLPYMHNIIELTKLYNKSVLRTIDECTLTVNMRKGAEDATWAVASLLYVVAFGGFVDLGMKLLFRASMTVCARVPLLAVARLTPFLAVFHVRAWRRTAIIVNV